MTDRFSDRLRRASEPLWAAQHQHPFVRGLGDGSLDPARFQVWLQQDYLFLLDSARLYCVGAARGDVETMRWMIAMAHGVFQRDLLLHQAYAVEGDCTVEEFAGADKLPTTRAYTDHLLRSAALGSQLELIAALLPALWGQAEVGQRAAEGRTSSRYSRWLDTYSGPVVEGLGRQGRDLLDRLAQSSGDMQRASAEEAFATSSAYELRFWEMCLRGETWP